MYAKQEQTLHTGITYWKQRDNVIGFLSKALEEQSSCDVIVRCNEQMTAI